MKENKGITLVALVVTIIILVILATISITFTLGNNGVFKQAEEASTINRGATVQERVDFYKMDYEAKKYIDTWETQSEEDLLNKLLQEKLVKEEEIDRTNKTITVRDKVIDYNIITDETVFIMTINSGEDAKMFSPCYGENLVVDWGDGTKTSYNPNKQIESTIQVASIQEKYKIASIDGTYYHTYPQNNKEYQIKIKGKIKQIYIYNSEYTDRIVSIDQWGDAELDKIDFSDCINLRKIASPKEKTFMNVISFENAFENCKSLKKIPENLFSNSPNVTSFATTFGSCTALQTIPENLFSNGTNVTSFAGTFSGCTALETIPENLFSNAPNVENFNSTFFKCAIQTIPENLFSSCSKVTSFWGTFENCIGLESIPENLFKNCVNVTDFRMTFGKCLSLQAIPETLFSNCPNVTYYIMTFYLCENVKGKAPELWKLGTNSVENNYVGNPNGAYCFGYGKQLTNYAEIPEKWKQEVGDIFP